MMWKRFSRVVVAGVLWCSQSFSTEQEAKARTPLLNQRLEQSVVKVNIFLSEMKTTQNLFKFFARFPGPEQKAYQYLAEHLPNEKLPQVEVINGKIGILHQGKFVTANLSDNGAFVVDGIQMPAAKKTPLEVIDFVISTQEQKMKGTKGAHLWMNILFGTKAYGQRQSAPVIPGNSDLLKAALEFKDRILRSVRNATGVAAMASGLVALGAAAQALGWTLFGMSAWPLVAAALIVVIAVAAISNANAAQSTPRLTCDTPKRSGNFRLKTGGQTYQYRLPGTLTVRSDHGNTVANCILQSRPILQSNPNLLHWEYSSCNPSAPPKIEANYVNWLEQFCRQITSEQEQQLNEGLLEVAKINSSQGAGAHPARN